MTRLWRDEWDGGMARRDACAMVLADLADVEVHVLSGGQVEAADAGGRCHGQAFGQAHADVTALQHSNIARLALWSGQAG
jgi:hypothetical protein